MRNMTPKKPRAVEYSEEELAALRTIGKRHYKIMVQKLGKKKLAQIARQQGEHGIEGGRPPLYPPCPIHPATEKTPRRHRFVNGICACGQRQR